MAISSAIETQTLRSAIHDMPCHSPSLPAHLARSGSLAPLSLSICLIADSQNHNIPRSDSQTSTTTTTLSPCGIGRNRSAVLCHNTTIHIQLAFSFHHNLQTTPPQPNLIEFSSEQKGKKSITVVQTAWTHLSAQFSCPIGPML